MPIITRRTFTTPLDFPGVTPAPPVAPAGEARGYFDPGSGLLMVSESGGAYVPWVGGGGVTFPLIATPTGSPAAPAYSFLGSLTTGAYSDAVGEYGMAAAGVELARLTDSMLLAAKGFGTVEVSPAALAAGNTNNYAIAAGLFFRMTTTAPGSTITGIVAPNPARSRFLYFVNLGPATLTFTNQDVASVVGNRIITTTGAPAVLNVNSKALLVYDATTARWRMLFSI